MRQTVMIMTMLILLIRSATAAEFFVSPDGNDTNPGTKAKPFATLERARNAVRALKKKPGMPKGGVTVFIRGGTYPLKAPLVFGPEDSGTETSLVTYTACPGETPVLSGGRRISGWKQVTADPENVAPEAKGKLWTAEVTKGWCFNQMFVDGRRQTRARSPNGRGVRKGYFRGKQVTKASDALKENGRSVPGTELLCKMGI